MLLPPRQQRLQGLSCRWLRFPCCGMRFPCDLCHEEGTDGHEMVWATRMLCGFCSTEQASSFGRGACGSAPTYRMFRPSAAGACPGPDRLQ